MPFYNPSRNIDYAYKCILIVAFVIASDQSTKLLAYNYLNIYTPIEIFPMLNLHLTYNTGIIFGVLSGYSIPPLILALVTIIASIVVAYLIYYNSKNKLIVYSLSLIVGGGLGNSIDRIIYGAVIDFIDVHINNLHWPSFNLADMSINIGAAGVIFGSIIYRRQN